MLCPQCRADVPAGARFCPSCGHELVVVGDQRRIASVLFADLVGFTALSESLDPEQVKAIVDRCFERLAADIEAYGGWVDKVIGDAIVGLFGAPVSHEDDAERAVRAGLRMQQTIAAVADEIGHPVQMRVGINTGEVVVGAVQAGREYTAMGDVVNTASRLQEAADPGAVFVGPDTHAATSDVIAYDTIDPLLVKGKEQPVQAWRAMSATAPPGRRSRGVDTPLLGRETELSLLNSITSTAIERSRASVLVIHGEAGMGKSRLAAEAMAHASNELGALTLEGRCVPYGEANVWWPVADAIRTAAGIDPDARVETVDKRLRQMAQIVLEETGRQDEVDRVVAGLLHLLGYDSLSTADPTRAREEAIRSVVAVSEGYTYRRPVMLSFSDMHWADDAVLDLVDTLLARLARRPFVMLATARRGLRDRWVPTPDAANAVALHLDPLDAEASKQLLGTLSEDDIDSDLAAMLIERASGNPFYLEELMSLVREAGIRTRDELLETEAGELPSTLRGLVAARLDALSPADRTVLDDAAVIGRSSSIIALARMQQLKRGMDGETARAHIENLAAREFFVIDGDRYSFRSDVIREVAYTTLTKADRARAHAEIAEWLTRQESEGDPEHRESEHAVAHHFSVAADLVADIGAVRGVPNDVRERAITWLLRASDRAEREFLSAVVSSLLGRAVGFMAADDPRRSEVLCRRAHALADEYRLSEAEAAVNEARGATAADDAVGHARVDLAESVVAQRRGVGPSAVASARQAHARFVTAGDLRGQADSLRQIGLSELMGGDISLAETVLLEARSVYTDLDDVVGVAWAQQHLAWCSFVVGSLELAEKRIDAATEIFSRLGDSGGLTWTRGLLAWIRMGQGRIAEAMILAPEVEAEAHRSGERWGEAMMMTLNGVLALWEGQTASAISRLQRAVDRHVELDEPLGLAQALGSLARARVMAGDLTGAAAEIAKVEDLSTRRVLPATRRWMIGLVDLAIANQIGDVDRAAQAIEAVENGTPDPIGVADWHVQNALAAVLAGRLDRARAELDLVEEERGFVAAVRALHAVASGDVDAAMAHAEDVASMAHTYLDRMYGDLALGLALVASGRVHEAEACLATRIATLDSTGDLVAGAVARTVSALVAERCGLPDAVAVRSDADRARTAAGIDAGGWSSLVSLVLSSAP